MSSKKLQIRDEVRADNRKLADFLKEIVDKKFDGNAAEMARFLPTEPPNIDRWLKGTTIPAWVWLRLSRRFPDVASVFSAQTEIVADPTEVYDVDPKRSRLVRETKELARDPGTPDRVIEALLRNVEVFKEVRKKQPEEQ